MTAETKKQISQRQSSPRQRARVRGSVQSAQHAPRKALGRYIEIRGQTLLRIMLWEGTLSLYCTPRSVKRFGMVYDISIILKAEESTHRAMLWDAALKAEGKSRSVSLPIVRQPA